MIFDPHNNNWLNNKWDYYKQLGSLPKAVYAKEYMLKHYKNSSISYRGGSPQYLMTHSGNNDLIMNILITRNDK